MIPTTLPTLTAVQTIHKAQHLLETVKLPAKTKHQLQAMTDAVLSFTAYYLRFANPNCRPEQADALNSLIALVAQLEKTHGYSTTDLQLADQAGAKT